MVEIRVGHNEYDNDYILKMVSSYIKISKLKMFIQVDVNKFIRGEDINKIKLPNEKYKLFLNTIDNVLVFRF